MQGYVTLCVHLYIMSGPVTGNSLMYTNVMKFQLFEINLWYMYNYITKYFIEGLIRWICLHVHVQSKA